MLRAHAAAASAQPLRGVPALLVRRAERELDRLSERVDQASDASGARRVAAELRLARDILRRVLARGRALS